VAGHSRQFTPGGYLSAVIDSTLAGIEPTNLPIVSPTRRRATSRAIEPVYVNTT